MTVKVLRLMKSACSVCPQLREVHRGALKNGALVKRACISHDVDYQAYLKKAKEYDSYGMGPTFHWTALIDLAMVGGAMAFIVGGVGYDGKKFDDPSEAVFRERVRKELEHER